MLRAQVIADLSYQLAPITTTEQAMGMVRRALRTAGLERHVTLDEVDLGRLLTALATEDGGIQAIAERIALEGLQSALGDGPEAA